MLPLSCGTAISALLFHMARDHDAWHAWSGWFPSAIQPTFHDLWVTLRHLHEAELGLDPLSDSTSDFAYPRAILLLRFLGLHHVPAEWLGFIQGMILTLGVVLVLRPRTPRRAIGTSLLFFTPPIAFGFERANVDFALFLLCAATAWQWSRSKANGNLILPIGAAIAGSLLKLYPVFALIGGAIAETGRRRLLWLLGIGVVVAYWYVNFAELALVLEKVPIGTSASWGCMAFFARVERFVGTDPATFGWLAYLDWRIVAMSLYVVASAIAAAIGFRLWTHFRAVTVQRTEWTYFWVGALICCGSFFAANYSYRWVFILLTLPLLLRCMGSAERVVVLWSRITVASILLTLAAPLSLTTWPFVIVQALNWLCILSLITGCVALRVSAKSPVFAFLLRLCSKQPSAAPVALDTAEARSGSR